MSFSRRLRFSWTIAALAVFAVLPTFTRADDVRADRRLPPQVYFYISIPDAPAMADKLHQTAFGQMINDPAMADIREELLSKFGELSEEFEDKSDVLVSDVLAMFSGEVSFAIARPLGQGIAGVGFVDIGGHRDILDQLLSKLDEGITTAGAQKSTEDLDGHEVTVYTHNYSAPGPAQGKSSSLAYLVKDETLVFGMTFGGGVSTGVIEDVLSRWDGTDANCFATSATFSRIIETCQTDKENVPAMTYFVDPVGLTSAGLSMSPETQMAGILFTGYLPAIGLNKFKGFGGTVEMATEEFDSVSRTLICCDQPTTGLLKVFEFQPTIEGPPAWVPEDASNYMAFDWNVAGAYDAIASLYDSFMGGPGEFDRIVSRASVTADGEKLNPKTDIIDALTGRVEMFINTPKPGETPDVGVLSLGVKDSEKAQKLLTAFAKSADFSEEDEVGGQPLFHSPNGPGAISIQGDKLFIGGSSELLQRAISAEGGGSLSASDSYQTVKPYLPEKVSIMTFANPSDQMEEGYENVRSGKYNGLLEGKLDLSKLPPFEAVKPYLLPSVTYVVPTENGAMSVKFSVKKKPE